MGQAPLHGMRGILPAHLAALTDKLLHNAAEVKQTAALTYEQFLDSLATLSQLANQLSDPRGKKLVFLVKRGTDDSVLWRGTVRIKCHKVNGETNAIESTRILTLKQYLRLYNEVSRQAALRQAAGGAHEGEEGGERGEETLAAEAPSCLDASMILNGFDAAEAESVKEDDECVICMDRKSQLMLPCAHAYCEQCIDTWQGSHRSCPICRATVGRADDSWVLSEKPDDDEMTHADSRYVMGLIDRFPAAAPDESDSD